MNAWDRPYKGVRTDRYTYVVYTETGEQELYDRRKDPHQLRNVAAAPAYARIKARLAAKLAKLDALQGTRVQRPLRRRRAGARWPPPLHRGRARRRPRPSRGLHDARYCEIIELKGSPPDASATVWNTIGLNRCPAAWWNAFDAGDLARELGATLVVLNGPRHFLMDSVTASPGTRALLPRPAAAAGRDASRSAAPPTWRRTPYTDRIVARDNTWRWRRGRLVYELVAPGGDVYVMQAYSQIVDPKLTIGKLRTARPAARPAGRLALPRAPAAARARRRRRGRQGDDRPGRAAEHLPAGASATRPPRPAQAPPDERSTGTHARWSRPPRPGTIEDHGTVTGTPFGRGAVTILVALANGRATGTLPAAVPARARSPARSTCPSRSRATRSHFRGTARFTGGTGAYRGITSGALKARDDNTLDGQNGVVELAGFARY